jgi:hypothetical protein
MLEGYYVEVSAEKLLTFSYPPSRLLAVDSAASAVSQEGSKYFKVSRRHSVPNL